ncbi:DNA mismatch repair protein MutS [Acidaminococcus sp. NSJ-142]|uniref:DNA mismatch repair protein MutS n=1 Tax=Acidaminococcus TaxID=904 RepID=UPI000CF85759|nr:MULTISPECIES: DNA mismatch repair protein MutS [Acidaminococcus]MCD2434668.1 DNA mismatch repair protein MutS [Acidaminococcus hominis]RHK03400.1 DNA mismatch repair protein MutS [Acidaminococcus sp. AM05-11]
MTTYTPMVQQYLKIKEEHQGELLFFRLGDFYELFFDDAITASRELNLTLTKRAGGSDAMPMCGVPFHSVDSYLAKLIKKGYKIAICDQMEDPKKAVGIVKREVTKILTPGTVLSDAVLEENHNQYLACLTQDQDNYCLAFADVSTGECAWYIAGGKNREEAVLDQLYRLQPAELVLTEDNEAFQSLLDKLQQKLPDCMLNHFDPAPGLDYFSQHFGSDNPALKRPLVHRTVEAMLQYIHENVKSDLAQINQLQEITTDQVMALDATAIRNLELVKNMRDGSRHGTLLDVLDYTQTAMGARQLRQWVEAPLLDVAKIRQRQQAIGTLVEDVKFRNGLGDSLKEITDLERILSRLEVGSANARDMAALRAALRELPQIKKWLGTHPDGLLRVLNRRIALHSDILDVLERGIVDEPPFSLRDGGMIRTGFNAELDELHDIAENNNAWMQNFEQKIKEETGIRTLKVGFNKVFGYYIEVSKGMVSQVPDNFVRKQTLVNGERYIVPELKEFENKILSAKEKIQQLEYYLFNEIRQEIRDHLVEIQETARAIGELDVLYSLAMAAFKGSYVCPRLNERQEIQIKDGRHPVVEKLLERELFVPNDVHLNNTDERLIILTGPNMAGKSTYMRQVALLTLMAQMGSFIPAREADICPVDRIFTRVGASDDLATGQSTFMVEMNEVANILKYATSRSLIILDEVGRGTSTYDGMSIARAVVEFINEKIKAKTLFATHYHELIELEDQEAGIKNYSVAVKEKGREVLFLRRIVPGGTDRSYGIHVAKLAGLPDAVVKRADELLAEYAKSGLPTAAPAPSKTKAAPEPAPAQQAAEPSLFGDALRETLCSLDVMTMTPLEALNTLYKLQEEAKREGGKTY